MSVSESKWNEVVKSALLGDRAEYGRLARLVTGHLAHWHAYDLHSDWDDIVQDVLLSVLDAYQEGRLDSSGAVHAYLRKATRFKFIDRIRRGQRWRSEGDPEELERDGYWPPANSLEAGSTDLRLSLEAALGELPESERLAIVEVHIRRSTIAEATKATGLSRAKLERDLKTGLARLRRALDEPRPM